MSEPGEVSGSELKRTIAVVVGPPASGKGAVARLLADKLQIGLISLGREFRRALNRDDPLATCLHSLKGKALFPDEIAVGLLTLQLSPPRFKRGFVLDGFPANERQAEFLTEVVLRPSDVFLPIALWIDEAVSLERLSQRWFCEHCDLSYSQSKSDPHNVLECTTCRRKLTRRYDDQTVDAAKARFASYARCKNSLLSLLAMKSRVHEVDSARSVAEVTAEVAGHVMDITPHRG